MEIEREPAVEIELFPWYTPSSISTAGSINCWVGMKTEPFLCNKRYGSIDVPILRSTRLTPWPNNGGRVRIVLAIKGRKGSSLEAL